MHRNRLIIFLVVFLLSFMLLVGRLAWMTILSGEYYEEVVERKRRRVQINSGARGTIYDRARLVLARDTQVFDATFVLPQLDVLILIKPLVCRVTGVSEERLSDRLEEARSPSGEQMLLPQISHRAARKFRYLSEKYPEKYGSLIVRSRGANGHTECSLAVDMRALRRKEETLKALAELLGVSFDELAREVEKTQRRIAQIKNSYQRRYELYMPRVLVRNIPREKVEELEVNYHAYPGIVVTSRMARFYPGGDLACHVLGFLRQLTLLEYRQLRAQGRTIRRGWNELKDFEKMDKNPFFVDDLVGATGIERVYDSRIRPSKGARLLEQDTRTPQLQVLREVPPSPGGDIHLTLDAYVQRAAQDAFSDAGLVGAAVVMDVETGAVLALASSPGYDLNTFRRDKHIYQEHSKPPYPLLNRALCALAPGSGFKLVTAVAGLEEGVITPETTHYCRGYLHRPGEWRCWLKTGHGSIGLPVAIEGSCNVYFYWVGEKLGHEKLKHWSHILGLGRQTGIDLPGEAAGLIPSPEYKKSRLHSSRSRLRRFTCELDYVRDELNDISRLEQENGPENGGARDNSRHSEHLKKLRARLAELRELVKKEKEKLTFYESERAWVPGDTRNMAIGQGLVLTTPLQMARLVGAIANGGRLFRPHLVAQPGEDYLERRLPVSPETLGVVRSAMRQVVFGAQGTARQEGLRKHGVAAKTGTAELGGVWNNAWIVGYAPCDAPRVAFAVVAERVVGHGGDVAGPVAAKILDAWQESESRDRKAMKEREQIGGN